MKNELVLTPLDRHFAALMERLAGGAALEVNLAAGLASHYRGLGHICLPVGDVAGGARPKLKPWLTKLRASPVVGAPGEAKPLILDRANRLYLRRYWEYETQLAAALAARIDGLQPEVDHAILRKGLETFFGASGSEFNRQKLAAFTALTRNLTIISGGPGTGKTRTVVMILALLAEQSGAVLRVALAAPTGKAAARLKEAIEATARTLPEALRARLPNESTTLHRLLGVIPNSPYFRHDAQHPLTADVVVVDEASMVDLALMAKLAAAVPAHARLILLGDKDQLASVEAGAVLGDICNTGVELGIARSQAEEFAHLTGEKASAETEPSRAPIHEHIVELRRNYRFTGESGIARLSQMINRGDADGAVEFLAQTSNSGDVTARATPGAKSFAAALAEIVAAHYGAELTDAASALERFGRFRILCALRQGPFGAENCNRVVERILTERGRIEPRASWYAGRPVMITRNDYNLKLFNGDIGIVLPDPESDGDLRVFFPGTEGNLRRFLPSRLPAHETAFAMTVHKSQGSEFDRVLLILPDAENPVVTRELLYTGLTRARSGVELWYREPLLRAAIGTRIARASGLRDALWSTPG